MPGEPPPMGAAGRRRPTDGRQLRGDVAVRRRAPGSRCCSSTASRGRGRTGSRTSPTSLADHRVIALDLPGFGHCPMPAWRISIESYGRLLHRFCDALGVGDCVVVGNSMGGFISAEAASAERGRFEKLVLVSAAGRLLARGCGAGPPRRRRGWRPPLLRCSWSSRSAACGGHGVRWATFKGLFQHPELLRRELLLEQFHNGAGRPGFLPAVQGLIGYDILDQLDRGRRADADRLGPKRSRRPAAGRGRIRPAPAQLADRDLRRHRALPQLERPVRFNRVLETFLAE